MSRAVHVCFDGVMDAARSGGWRVLMSTLRALARRPELELTVIIPADRQSEFADVGGVRLIPVPQRPERPLQALAWRATTLPGVVRKLRADVLHVPSHNLLIARTVCPTVLTIHDVTEFHLRGHYDPLRMFYRRLVVPRNARLADRIATVSAWVGHDITATLGIQPDRIVVAPNGVESSFRAIPAADAHARVREQCGLEPPYLLYVGQIHMPNKNLVRLVEAFAHARPRLPTGTRLVLAGRDVTGGDQVRATIQALGLGDTVRHIGYVPDGVLPALYSGALAFCYVSLHEGFGLPVLEAMSCAVPVLTSNTTALAEIGRDAALLVDPTVVPSIAEGMVRITGDTELRERLRRAGLERARAYTWDGAAAILSGVYQALAANDVSRRRDTAPRPA